MGTFQETLDTNSPFPRDPLSPDPEVVSREPDPLPPLRMLVRCPLPVISSLQAAMEVELCRQFGGFTRTPMAGGWVADDGATMIETGSLYEVSVTPENADAVTACFEHWGERMGQTWVHVECVPTTVHHTRVR